MPAGEPTWTCRFCGRTYYAVSGSPINFCNCEKSVTDMFQKVFTPGDMFPVPTPAPKDQDVEVGVIVGRFQCSYVHEGYKDLIKYVSERHPRVMVFIGQSLVQGTKRDPLNFHARRLMLQSEFPDLEIYKLDDIGDVDKWSVMLDKQIALLLNPMQKAVLYGSRDRFKYTGKFPVVEMQDVSYISSSKIRKQIAVNVQNDQKWREGVIYRAMNQFDKVQPTVDIAVVDFAGEKVLLGKKPSELLWRFPGGFSSPSSPSYEIDALRELKEETRLNAEAIEYIGSTLIEDPRYLPQSDKIKTSFYAVTKWNGDPVADDDLGEVKWFSFTSLENSKEEVMMPTHHVLHTMFFNWVDRIKCLTKQINKA